MAFGLRPVQARDGGYVSGGNSAIPIADLQTTSFFNGEPVGLTGGVVTALAGVPQDNANPTIGVFVGCEYTNADGQTIHSHYYPGNALNTNITAYVITNPDTLFRVQGTSAWAVAQKGTQVEFAAGTDDTSTGNSGYNVVNGTPTVTGGAIIIDVIKDGENENSATPWLIVAFSAGTHSGLV